MGKWEVMEGVCRLKIGGARHPTDILECALEYQKGWEPLHYPIQRRLAQNI